MLPFLCIIGIARLIFLASYLVFALGRLPGTKIDRTAMAVIGAVAMFVFGVLSPAQALESINFATIVLLFSMMLIAAALHLAGFFEWIAHLVIEHLDPRHLLPGVVFTSGILSAFLVNDVVCLVMAPLVLEICRRMRVKPLPYLLALATASNIGSTASITGNPQNILIASVSGISYRSFAAHLGPVALVGLFVDWAILHFCLCAARCTGRPPAGRRTGNDRAQTRDTSSVGGHGHRRRVGGLSHGISSAARGCHWRCAAAGAAPSLAEGHLWRRGLVTPGAV